MNRVDVCARTLTFMRKAGEKRTFFVSINSAVFKQQRDIIWPCLKRAAAALNITWEGFSMGQMGKRGK